MNPEGGHRRDLLLLCLLLVAARAWIVLSLGDVFFAGEEQSHGAVSKAVLDGVDAPLQRVVYQYYEGGGLVASLLTVPVFALIGPSLLAHKLVALGFDLANLALGWSLAHRWFGRRAALVFALLYTFGPAACQQIAMLNVGNHWQAISFLFLIAHLALPAILRDPATPVRAGRCLGLGLVSGFAVYFDFLAAAMVGLVAIALLVVPPRLFAWKSWALLAAGFLVGALPILWMYGSVGTALFDVHGIDLLDPFGAPPTGADRGHESALSSLVAALEPRGIAVVLLLSLLPLLGCLAWRSRPEERPARAAWLFLLVFLVLFSAASVASRFTATYFVHYSAMMRFVPHWGVAALLAAAVLGHGLGSAARPVRWASLAATALLVGNGVAAAHGIASAGTARSPAQALSLLAHLKGYEYFEYLPKFSSHLAGDPERRLEILLSFDEPDRGLLYPAAATAVLPLIDGPVDEHLLEVFRRADPEHWREFLPGLGPRLAVEDGDLLLAVSVVPGLPDYGELRLLYYEAIGRQGRGLHPLPENVREEVRSLIQAGAPGPAFFGMGFRLHQAFRLDPAGARALIAEFEAPVSILLERGYSRARVLYSVDGVVGGD